MEIPCCSFRSKLLCLSTGSLVLLLVAILSFFLGRALPRVPTLDRDLRGTPTTPISTSTPDETTNWKTYTYRDTEYGFEFKHPKELTYQDEWNQKEIISKTDRDLYVIEAQIEPFSGENDNLHLMINIWDNPQKLSTTDWLKQMWASLPPNLPSDEKNTPLLKSNIFIDNLPAYKDTREVEYNKQREAQGAKGGEAFPIIYCYVSRNDKVYAIVLDNYDPEAFGYKYEVIYDTFDQILSTFKFLPPIESVEIDETNNWKTYTNRNLLLSFRYPNNLILSESNERVSLDEEEGVENNSPLINFYIKTFETGFFEDWIRIEYDRQCPGNFGSCTSLERIKRFQNAYSLSTKNRHYAATYTYINVYRNKRVFVLEMSARKPNEQFAENELKLYNQILSTFQFLD